jgi:hypothetical protein
VTGQGGGPLLVLVLADTHLAASKVRPGPSSRTRPQRGHFRKVRAKIAPATINEATTTVKAITLTSRSIDHPAGDRRAEAQPSLPVGRSCTVGLRYGYRASEGRRFVLAARSLETSKPRRSSVVIQKKRR